MSEVPSVKASRMLAVAGFWGCLAVMDAVSNGTNNPEAIVTATGLPAERVGLLLRQMRSAGLMDDKGLTTDGGVVLIAARGIGGQTCSTR